MLGPSQLSLGKRRPSPELVNTHFQWVILTQNRKKCSLFLTHVSIIKHPKVKKVLLCSVSIETPQLLLHATPAGQFDPELKTWLFSFFLKVFFLSFFLSDAIVFVGHSAVLFVSFLTHLARYQSQIDLLAWMLSSTENWRRPFVFSYCAVRASVILGGLLHRCEMVKLFGMKKILCFSSIVIDSLV